MVHGRVGVSKERSDIVAVRRVDGNADARRGKEFVASNYKWFSDGLHDAVCNLRSVLLVLEIDKEHCEFIAA